MTWIRTLTATLALSTLVFVLAPSEALALHPSRVYKQQPEKFNMKYEAVKVPTADGATLAAWVFPVETKGAPVVLISHSGEGNMADYLRQVDAFHVLGFTVVIYDYRGFGESSEFEINNNMYLYPQFQDDIQAMIDYCRSQRSRSVHLYGFGIGAGLSLGVGWLRPEVVSIVADTPFLSMEDLERRFSSWDTPMEVPFAGYDKKHEPGAVTELAPSASLKQVLIIVGEKDALFKEADYVALSSKRPKAFAAKPLVVQGSDGKDNFRADKAAYVAQLKAFYEGLGEGAPAR